jgi:hypothetical protein
MSAIGQTTDSRRNELIVPNRLQRELLLSLKCV